MKRDHPDRVRSSRSSQPVLGAGARPAAAGANLCVGTSSGVLPDPAGGGRRGARRRHHSRSTGEPSRAAMTVGVSVAIVGAGASQTTISGGGPVLTASASTRPQPSRRSRSSGVTITGGTNTTLPDPSVAFGGGVWIPLSRQPFSRTGATVSISNSRDHRQHRDPELKRSQARSAAARTRARFDDGGGIDNAGVLTLTSTVVSNNQAGTPARSVRALPTAASTTGSSPRSSCVTVRSPATARSQARRTARGRAPAGSETTAR